MRPASIPDPEGLLDLWSAGDRLREFVDTASFEDIVAAFATMDGEDDPYADVREAARRRDRLACRWAILQVLGGVNRFDIFTWAAVLSVGDADNLVMFVETLSEDWSAE